ncbi:MAG: hypothetical protein DSY42_07895 [Aquifex sp.]|nr:MAG: hypothetical protein DSY42_07895 [Aquifex sp.]
MAQIFEKLLKAAVGYEIEVVYGRSSRGGRKRRSGKLLGSDRLCIVLQDEQYGGVYVIMKSSIEELYLPVPFDVVGKDYEEREHEEDDEWYQE